MYVQSQCHICSSVLTLQVSYDDNAFTPGCIAWAAIRGLLPMPASQMPFSPSGCCALQIGSLYLNAQDALADTSSMQDPCNSSNFALGTLYACRQQLAEAGIDPAAWLLQQVAARGPTEIEIGLEVGVVRAVCAQSDTEVPAMAVKAARGCSLRHSGCGSKYSHRSSMSYTWGFKHSEHDEP